MPLPSVHKQIHVLPGDANIKQRTAILDLNLPENSPFSSSEIDHNLPEVEVCHEISETRVVP
jgi:hypothetical protein